MMKKIYRLTVLLLSFLIIGSVSKAQENDLNQTLSRLSADAARAYVAPIVSGFGANLNSGWMHRIPPAKKFEIDFELTVVGMGTFFNDNNKVFQSTGLFRFNRQQAYNMTSNISNSYAREYIVNQIVSQDFSVSISGPTIVGSKDQNLKIVFPGKTFTYNSQSFDVPEKEISVGVTGYLENLPVLPLGAPQLSIGTVYGTSLEFRFLPSMQINSDLGKFSYFGFGIQHNPALWFDNLKLPVDFSVGFYTQSMKVGNIFESSATAFGINAGRTFGWSMLNVTPYMGLQFESSKITVSYTQKIDTPGQPQDINVTFDLKGENSARLTVGAAFKLAILNLNVDYSLAKYNTASLGFGFVF